MSKTSPFAITISRQLGSGGAYLGQRLAARLHILYLDREIIYEAAKKLKVSEDTVASCDEKLTPLPQKLSKSLSTYSIGTYVPPALDMVTDETVHNTESEVIKSIAQERSVVVIGRGGFHVLKSHPRHLSIFLHADIDFRQQRVQKLYDVSERQALKLIESIDKERARYLHAMTGYDWTNALQYQLCLDTSVIGLDKAEEIIMDTVRTRLGNVIPA